MRGCQSAISASRAVRSSRVVARGTAWPRLPSKARRSSSCCSQLSSRLQWPLKRYCSARRWLLGKAWTAERNDRANRLGGSAVGKWLQRTLAEEAQAMPLQRAQQLPEVLADQLPRLQRMLVWLRLARSVLELPETDRLYGELAKLQELLATPEAEGRLDALAAQAHTVLTLKPWKALLK